ncbi:MAG: hypothetical protein M0008_09170, partial [Actinomycetota bacterium]|nr:hypothetical protein [Actinomycetota bacterium]
PIWRSSPQVTSGELDRLVAAARLLPEAVGTYLDEDYVVCLLSTVVDYQLHTTAVERALQHFQSRRRSDVATHQDLERLFAKFPDDRAGNTELAEYLWGFKLWTRAALLRRLAAYFASQGATDLESLRRWAESSEFKRDFEGKVRFSDRGTTYGLGYAIFNWLTMRLGAQSVKPDVHVRRFVEVTMGRRLSDQDVVEAVTRTAAALGITPRSLDWRIWEARGGISAAKGPGDAGTLPT